MRIRTVIFILLCSVKTFAHGEDKLGPHNGFISMPGAFHVELVPQGAHKINAYLLDIDWKNPSVEGSSVTLTHNSGKTAKCEKMTDHFTCQFAKTVNLKKAGHLTVEATREKQQGNPTQYALPLTLKAKD